MRHRITACYDTDRYKGGTYPWCTWAGPCESCYVKWIAAIVGKKCCLDDDPVDVRSRGGYCAYHRDCLEGWRCSICNENSIVTHRDQLYCNECFTDDLQTEMAEDMGML